MLARHFGCRAQDPTLDIWSNFVKKERKKHFTSSFEISITTGYQGLSGVTTGYHGLPRVTTGYHGLPRAIYKKDENFYISASFLFHPVICSVICPVICPPGYPPSYLPGYLMLPNLTNQVIKLSKCRPLVRMKFGPFLFCSLGF